MAYEGKPVFQFLAFVTELEPDLIREGVKAGLNREVRKLNGKVPCFLCISDPELSLSPVSKWPFKFKALTERIAVPFLFFLREDLAVSWASLVLWSWASNRSETVSMALPNFGKHVVPTIAESICVQLSHVPIPAHPQL